MKAIIMAGGEGTRLRPLTSTMPKPMTYILDRPVMEHIINLLKKYNITDIGVTLQYMPEVIKEHFGDGSAFGVNLQYFVEEKPLGTAGSVKNAEAFLDDTFIVISGDALTDIDIQKAVEFHHAKQAAATLILSKVEVPLEYGVVVTDESGKITRFIEKPAWNEVFSDHANTGIYILNPMVLGYIKKDEVFDFSKDLFPILLKEDKGLCGHVSDKYWCDIGDLKAYIRCNQDILSGKVEIQKPAFGFISGKAVIEEGAKIDKNVYIGDGAVIKTGAEVLEYSVIGENSVLEEYSSVKRSVVWKNAVVGRRAALRGAVLCNRGIVKNTAAVYEESVIGEGTVVGEQSIVKNMAKIWPSKVVDACSYVVGNIVWGSNIKSSLFEANGIGGDINIDVTPALACKLGAAFASVARGKVAVSSDGSNVSDMVAEGLISGLMSAGAAVYHFGFQPVSVTSFGIRFYGLKGGIHVGTYETENGTRVKVTLMDEYGSKVKRTDERKIENAYLRDDFVRAEAKDIKRVTKIHDFKSFYIREIVNHLDSKESLGGRILIDGKSAITNHIVDAVAYEAGVDLSVLTESVDSKKFSDIAKAAGIVSENGFDMGIVFEQETDRFLLIDGAGRVVNRNSYIAIMAVMILDKYKNAKIVTSITTPMSIDDMITRLGGEVVKTKTSDTDICEELIKASDKSYKEQFLMRYDGIYALFSLIKYLKDNHITLEQIVDELPRYFVSQKEVECTNSKKGTVIKELIERYKDAGKVELTEGIKIYQGDGWVLVLPDESAEVCHIFAEGNKEEYAEELAGLLADDVLKISRKQNA